MDLPGDGVRQNFRLTRFQRRERLAHDILGSDLRARRPAMLVSMNAACTATSCVP